jgi:Domain of unknown function (DUF3459)
VRALLRLRREDPVLRSPTARTNLRAHAGDGVLRVERSGERDEGRRTLLLNLSARAVTYAAAAPSREPLFRIGEVTSESLGPFAAVVLA